MLVNHILIGAGRSGTTTFTDYLVAHPSINSSLIKEVIYFSIDEHYSKGEQYLHSFFNQTLNLKINSTSDTYLLTNKVAAQRIKTYNSNMKISIILRDPTERAYSSYIYGKNNGHDKSNSSFIESLKREKEIISKDSIVDITNLCHFYNSLYYKHINMWMQYFPKNQLFICTTNQLKNNPKQLFNDLANFLAVDKSGFNLKVETKNKASAPKNKAIHQFLINRNHPLRKIVRVPLQAPLIKKLFLKANIVEKIKEANRKELNYQPMSEEERQFADNYFKKDKELLKQQFNVSFD